MPWKKYPNFMGSPFGGGGAVESPFSTDWAARHLRAVGMLPHCRSLPLSCSVHSALPYPQLQLPALLTRVAGCSFHPPGVLSAGVFRMICLLSKARKAWGRRVGFFFCAHGDHFSPGVLVNATQRF